MGLFINIQRIETSSLQKVSLNEAYVINGYQSGLQKPQLNYTGFLRYLETMSLLFQISVIVTS